MAAVWQKASQSNNDLRALLGDGSYSGKRRDDVEQSQATQSKDPATAFFPAEWSNCLTEETLADLIVDAYSGAFCEAFLDGSISLVEVANKMNFAQDASLGNLQKSMSEPSLLKPSANRRLRITSHTDKALLSMGHSEQQSSSSDGGFTMNGLTKDPWEAWNSRNFHKCKPLDPFVKRIERATEMQRPSRRIVKRPEESPDLRKYVLPMSATHFPEAWDRAPEEEKTPKRQSAAQRSATASSAQLEGTEEAPDEITEAPDEGVSQWLLKVGKEGKTTFPYSLVSHRAFLESQSDPILKEKARKIAPLRLTNDW